MGAFASLNQTSIVVEPGGEAVCELKVVNTGVVVDQFTFEVVADRLGSDQLDWVHFDPPVLSLFPNTEGVVVIRFRPPRQAGLAAGQIGFAVKVTSREDPMGSVVEEGTLEIGRFVEVDAELAPTTRTARRSGRYRLAMDNFGNSWVNASVNVIDPNESLKFRFTPAISAESGTRTMSRLQARPHKRMWRGSPKIHPFQVAVEPEGAAPVTVNGQLVQAAIIPTWLIFALLALAGLVLLWALLLKPTIESAAKVAAIEDVKAAADDAAAAADDAKAAADDAAASEQKTDDRAKEVLEKTEPEVAPVATTIDQRLAPEQAEPGGGGTLGEEQLAVFAVEKKQKLSITDIVLQNPEGDSGILTIERRVTLEDGTTERTTILQFALENFRDLDFHFVTPIVFTENEELLVSVRCRAGGGSAGPGPPTPCNNEAVQFTGTSEKPPPENQDEQSEE